MTARTIYLLVAALAMMQPAYTQSAASYVSRNVAGVFPIGDGGPATSALLESPQAAVADANGVLYIADSGNGAIRKVARNGTIIPLDSGGGMGLHYFPALGAEFFVLEKDVNEWTQIHAAPADDVYRLEIDSRVARSYQWVVHHVERPASVGFEDRKFTEAKQLSGLPDAAWFYDAGQKNLHIKARVGAREDSVIHVRW